MFLGPVKDIDHRGPVGFFPEVRLTRLRPRDDDPVKSAAPEIIQIPVEILQMLFSAPSARYRWERIQFDANRKPARSLLQKVKELRLSILKGRVRHIVNKRNLDWRLEFAGSCKGSRREMVISCGPVGRSSPFVYHL